jgi:hypothetical protein
LFLQNVDKLVEDCMASHPRRYILHRHHSENLKSNFLTIFPGQLLCCHLGSDSLILFKFCQFIFSLTVDDCVILLMIIIITIILKKIINGKR